MTAAPDIGLEPVADAPKLPPVYLSNGSPIAVLGTCKKVALKADWSLQRWTDFATAYRGCFSADALPEDHARALDIVRLYFTVTLGPRFSANVAQWEDPD